jgi:hypothetical protein
MPLDKYRIAIRILLHSCLQTLSQIFLVCSVLDNGYPQAVVVSQVALLATTLWYALYLLNLFDLEACVRSEVALDE